MYDVLSLFFYVRFLFYDFFILLVIMSFFVFLLFGVPIPAGGQLGEYWSLID
jgi:hypothetical protein